MELLPVRETTGVAAFYSIKNAMLELGTNQFHFNGIFARTAGSHQVCASRLGESCVKLVTSRWRDPAIPPWPQSLLYGSAIALFHLVAKLGEFVAPRSSFGCRVTGAQNLQYRCTSESVRPRGFRHCYAGRTAQ
jgi:hypothetical protein